MAVVDGAFCASLKAPLLLYNPYIQNLTLVWDELRIDLKNLLLAVKIDLK